MDSFYALTKFKKEFQESAGSPMEKVPFILVGNKADLIRERKVKSEDINKWCKANGNITYYETSAKTAVKVKEAFENLAKFAISYRDHKLYYCIRD